MAQRPEPPDASADPPAIPPRVIFAVFAASLVFTLGDGSIQLILAPHLENRGISPAAIGPIVAAYSVASLAFRFITGAVYRAHLIRYLAFGGCLLSAGAFLLISQATHPAVLAAGVAVNGAGFAITSTGVLAAVMDLRRGGNAGVAMGMYTGFIGAGYSLASFLGGAVGDAVGVATAMRLLAILPVIAGVSLLFALAPLQRIHPRQPASERPRQRRTGNLLSNVSVYVWLAFFCALHINLLSGVLSTFFPLFGLSIGLTLTQIGALQGLHSGVSSAVRFSSAAIFSRISYRASLPWMVVLGSLSTAALTISELFWVLAIGWFGIGVSRGILRVASAALAMDASSGPGASSGSASGVYMAGLDIGRIVGPIAGGFVVDAWGYLPTFLLAAVTIPAIFFAFYASPAVRARQT